MNKLARGILAGVMICTIAYQPVVVMGAAATAKAPAKKVQMQPKLNTNKVVVTVNGHAYTWNSVAKWLRPQALTNNVVGLTPVQLDQYVTQSLDQFVFDRLMLEWAKANKVVADSKETDKQYATMDKAMIGPNFFKSRKSYQKALLSYGLTAADIKQMVRESLTGAAVQKALIAAIPVSDQIVHDQYVLDNGKAKARHILVDTEERAKEVKTQLDAGGDFAALARVASSDGSASKGGDLGEFKLSDMDPAFSKAVIALKPDQISDPVQSQFGYHIIQLIELTPPDETKFEAAKAGIVKKLREDGTQAAFDAFVTMVKGKAKIVYPTAPKTK